ncbi:hypothetical protein GCM10010178_76820 [Lentzea flava]|uniref:Uncharacterized protein n=1 Tax=Lentzea flava TaxID=103732 RepID=A0ABQ2V9P1_9PSEU|nr:hypothetical protein [Lentzea flava]GGU73997.1 hypothetical protein GCM10010178_76820 [Lentzea flava]
MLSVLGPREHLVLTDDGDQFAVGVAQSCFPEPVIRRLFEFVLVRQEDVGDRAQCSAWVIDVAHDVGIVGVRRHHAVHSDFGRIANEFGAVVAEAHRHQRCARPRALV